MHGEYCIKWNLTQFQFQDGTIIRNSSSDNNPMSTMFQFQDGTIIKMTLNDIVASKIKDNRKHVGFTSEAVAEMIGASKGAYSNLENGKVEITIAKLELLSKIFSRPMESFLPLG